MILCLYLNQNRSSLQKKLGVLWSEIELNLPLLGKKDNTEHATFFLYINGLGSVHFYLKSSC